MKRKTLYQIDIDGDTEDEDEDLWFLPGPIEEEAWDMPGPKADRETAIDLRPWAKAEGEQGQALAAAAAAFAALSERLSQMGQGAARRIALLEMAELSWAAGLRLNPEEIALHQLLRLPSLGEGSASLDAALWGVGRLVKGAGPRDGLVEFLGLRNSGALQLEGGVTDTGPGESPEIAERRPQGAEFLHLAGQWEAALAGMHAMHPLSRAAACFFTWRKLGLSGADDVIEAAVAAARIGAEQGRGAATFVPVALGDALVFRSGGEPEKALPRWLQAVENACLRALLHLDQLAAWKTRAIDLTADLSGRSPPLLIQAFLAHPALSAEMAAKAVGISPVGARRNLALLEARGVIRETTGQDRYRVFTACF